MPKSNGKAARTASDTATSSFSKKTILESKKAKAKAHAQSTSAPTSTRLYSSFLPIPLVLPSPVPIASTSSSSSSSSWSSSTKEDKHYIYVRPHANSTNASRSAKAKRQFGVQPSMTTDDGQSEQQRQLPENRTLFVVNLPVDSSERDLRSVFSKWGVVESIKFGGKEVDVLEQAVKGLPVEEEEDEDEDDENEEDEDEDEDENQEEGEEDGADAADENDPYASATFQGDIPVKLSKAQKRNIRRKGKNNLPPSVPDVIPLPPLDPRSVPIGVSGVKSAHVVFLDPVSVTRLMSSSSSPITPVSLLKNYPSEPTGLNYYTSLYKSLRPDLLSVKSFADSSMARFDHLHSLLLTSRAKAQGAGALVDEDGFTVVVRSGNYGRAGARGDALGMGSKGVGVASRGFDKKLQDKKKGKGAMELEGFYKFQRTDRKRQELADLRAKFESDKAKVEELKKSRRYKPY
ncbi:ribosomal RNA-processing protein 7 [Kwoniella heveanensis CBS 569]|nr:ribosomal RNA-processing protein 7 [Kwoniella heveanensis CBS 569]